MANRKLFYALKQGFLDQTVHIDKLDKKENLDQVLVCPQCKGEVIPKQGDLKIWHFAHKLKPCDLLLIDDSLNQPLAKFITATTDKIEVPEDPIFFMCKHCHKKERKELGIKWDGKEYVCRECFRSL